MKRFSPSTRYGWAFLAAALSFIEPSISGAQATSLRVGTNSRASTEAVLFSIAKDAGILKQHQLDAEVIYIAGGTLSMQALVGRSLDFMCTGGTPFIYAYLEGVQGKIIGGVNNRLPYGFVSLANIKTPAQLKGKRIGISRFGSTDDFAVKLALAQFGLNPKTDVSITQVGGAATRLTALQAASIDAAVLTLGLVQIAQKSNLNLLLDFIEKDIEYQQVAIIARDDLLKARPDVVRRFMKAYTEGIRYYKSQKEVAVRKTMEKLRTNDRAIGEFDYNQRVRALPDDAKPTIKGMQLALDDIAKDNPKAKNLTISQLVDLSFIP